MMSMTIRGGGTENCQVPPKTPPTLSLSLSLSNSNSNSPKTVQGALLCVGWIEEVWPTVLPTNIRVLFPDERLSAQAGTHTFWDCLSVALLRRVALL